MPEPPEGVLHSDWVQHLISFDPEHKLEVKIPLEQQPVEIQTPVYPDALQVAE